MMQTDPINSALDHVVTMATTTMAWVPSPALGVERKRLYRYGPPEAGQVTSIVRYLPGAAFPSHPHPRGEEIYVLKGVFSDATGDWPAGSYLLNPEGFEHSPYSDGGCELLVRLQQHPGQRQRVALLPKQQHWASATEASAQCILSREQGFPDESLLYRWAAGGRVSVSGHRGCELFIIDGTGVLDIGGQHSPYKTGDWLRIPDGLSFTSQADTASTVYIRQHHFPWLNQCLTQ
jgi:quercetin dioxygenase-like cupin family protein